MRLENAQVRSCLPDPRQVLCDTKYFGLRPEPLEQYLYGLALSQSAERVFWLHWTEGYRRGDFTSEISLKEAARRCHCDISTVTKAYQLLKRHKLILRQDPGRDPTRPFDQAIALTEVRLPPEALGQLLNAPDRGPSRAKFAQAEHSDKPAADSEPASVVSLAPARPVLEAWTARLEKLRVRLEPGDFEKYLTPIQPHQDGARLVLYAPNRFVEEWLTKQLREDLAEMAGEGIRCAIAVGARPAAAPASVARNEARVVPPPKPRALSAILLARLRKELSRLRIGHELPQRVQEIAWSIEHGALARYTHPLAINIAIKKVREGVWTRPNRMPPNWQFPAA